VKWPAVEQLATLMPLPAGYRIGNFDRAGIRPLVAALRRWHPEISAGASSGYLREEFYATKVCLDGEAETDIFVAPIRCGDELVGMWSVEREEDSLAIYGRLMVVAPEHRGVRLAVAVLDGSENVGRAMGAEFMYVFATLKNMHVQQALERAGYRLLGFFPGFDREEVEPGVVKRVYQAVYAKLLVEEDNVHRPSTANMTPRTNRIYELLFTD
jgi:GNAT superfamily N-acetyltransferase